ncbi:MAG: DUF3052 family protein [Cyclobacteriaceae bacterium]|nr:DUF3052 family protein [Cyclobacteriaceae bacterium]
MAGYSQTPLLKKLGIKDDAELYLFQPPENYKTLVGLPKTNVIRKNLSGAIEFIHMFVKDQKTFEKEFVRCAEHLKKDGMLWVSWPKKSSKVVTDLDENKIRDFGLRAGLVDVKVCAVDDTWSGLKFVFRLKDR